MSNIGITLTADDRELLRVLRSSGADIRKYADDTKRAMNDMGGAGAGAAAHMERLASGMRTAFIGGGLAASIIVAKNAIGGLTMAMVDAQMQSDKIKNSLSFAMGSELAAREIEYLRDVTNRLGVSFAAVAPMYGRLAAATKGTNLEGRVTREIFESIAQASVVMGLGAEESEGAMRALVQMVSKGQIMAEELRGQLGERLPRAFQIFAKSMGVSTAELSKLLDLGQVGPERLKEFAETLKGELVGSVEAASMRLSSSINRLDNAWLRLKQTIGESGVSQAISNETSGIANYMEALTGHMDAAKKSGSGMVGELSAGLGYIIARAPFDVLAGSASLLNAGINTLTGNAFRLNTNINLMPTAFESSARQAAIFAAELPKAEAELARLQKLTGTRSDSIYLRSEMATLSAYIAKMREALAAKGALVGLDAGAGRGMVNPETVGQMAEKRAKAEAELAEIRGRLAGVDKDYLPTLMKLNRAFESGIVSEKEYVRLVSELANKNYRKESTKGAGAALAIDKSQRDHDVEAIRKQLQLELDAYNNAEKIMEATRSAGLVSEAEYYEAKRAFIRLEAQANEAATRREIDRLRQEKLAGKDKIDNDRKIIDAEAKQAKMRADAVAALEVLSIQQTASTDRVKRSYEEARQAAQDYLDTLTLGHQRDLAAFGMGDSERSRLSGRAQIEDKYQTQRNELENTKRLLEFEGKYTEEARQQYETRLAIIREFQGEALSEWDGYYAALKRMEGDWTNGASRAIQNYRDTAANVASQTEQIYTRAFQGMEDAVVSFATTGKADFRSLADSIAADITRIIVKQQISNALGVAGGSGGSGKGVLDTLISAGASYFFGGGGFDMYGGASGAANSAIMSGVNAGGFGGVSGADQVTDALFRSMKSYDVGTDFVPYDMVARVHKGERIVPAAENKPGWGGGNQNIYLTVAPPAGASRASATQWGSEVSRQLQHSLSRVGR